MTDETITYEGPGELAVREEPRASLAIAPTVSPEEAKAAMDQYQAVCAAVLSEDDYQAFTEKKNVKNEKTGKWEKVTVTKRFKKKSAVKKLQTFWSVTVRVRDMQRDDLGDGHFGFRCIATASMPSGREVESTGGCSTFEDRFVVKQWDDEGDTAFARRQKSALARAYHDVMSTAETRATNRAVMNCIGVGGGEVTADEISRPQQQAGPSTAPPADATPKPRMASMNQLRELWERKGSPHGTLQAFAAWAFQKEMASLDGVQRGVLVTELERFIDPLTPVEAAEQLEAFALEYPSDDFAEVQPGPTAPPADPPKPPDPTATDDDGASDDLRAKEARRMRAICSERGIDDSVRRMVMLRLFGPKSMRAGKPSSTALSHAQLVQLNFELETYNA